MLASLEMRTPFLHHEVTELTAAAPTDLQLRNGGKAVLRALLKSIDPRLTRHPKTAFRVPAGEWLRGPLASLLDRQLESSPLYQDGWFNSGGCCDAESGACGRRGSCERPMAAPNSRPLA